MMEFGLGVMRWPEPVFWRTSMAAFNAAVAGYRKSQGIGATPGMTRARMEDLKRQFPDTPRATP
jgi:uncharacterized phage protein (TIGR02216 family)